MVAVGTSVARRPPHRSVGERLTHTAPASDDGGGASPTKASAPHAVQRLGHGLSASVCGPWRAQRRSPRPRPFPPDSSAGGCPPWFGPLRCYYGPAPTPRRRTRGACGVAEVSRFSRKEFAGVHGFPRPRRARAPLAKTRHAMWPSPFAHRVSARNSGFRGSLAGPPAPLSTLRPRRHRRRRMTRGQRGSLLLHCGALSSPTPRRFIPALSRKLSACRVDTRVEAWPACQAPKIERQTAFNTSEC